jgi:hypothetical protein
VAQYQPGSQQALDFLNQLLAARGVDVKAADAVFGREGASGGIGDGGHAFGPGQFNDAGGVWTGRYPGLSPQQKNLIAWSTPGLRELADRIASVASGQRGMGAIQNIVTRFERPANPGAEIAGAARAYGIPLRGSPGGAVGFIQRLAGTGGAPGGHSAPSAAPGSSGGMNQILGAWLLSQAQKTLSGQDDSGGLLNLILARSALSGQSPLA